MWMILICQSKNSLELSHPLNFLDSYSIRKDFMISMKNKEFSKDSLMWPTSTVCLLSTMISLQDSSDIVICYRLPTSTMKLSIKYFQPSLVYLLKGIQNIKTSTIFWRTPSRFIINVFRIWSLLQINLTIFSIWEISQNWWLESAGLIR